MESQTESEVLKKSIASRIRIQRHPERSPKKREVQNLTFRKRALDPLAPPHRPMNACGEENAAAWRASMETFFRGKKKSGAYLDHL